MSTQISLRLQNPSFSLRKEEYPAMYTLQFKQKSELGGVEIVDIELSSADFEALLTQGKTLVPSQQITLTSPQENESWREAAWPLFRLDDKEWQLLIKEIGSDKLIYSLWFLKNVELGRLVFRNMSARAASCLAEELCQRFNGKNPDEAPARETQNAHDCLREMLDVLARLQAEGQIEQWS